jgi:pimeloyl-ACP methyl ester carboxylesterase
MPKEMPAIVLVHGAFAESSSWNPVIKRLQERSLDVTAVANPLRSVEVDAAYVRDVIAALGRPVVLVGHSYGGIVITEAAAGNDAVVGLTYVAAFAPEHGESAFELSGKFPGSTLAAALAAHPLSTGGNELTIARDYFHQQFAADVPGGTAALMAATQRPITEIALTTGLPTNYPAWRTIPSWFVFGSDDRNIPAELIRFLAERAGSRGTHEIAGGSHALSVSYPDAVAAMIVRTAQAATQ